MYLFTRSGRFTPGGFREAVDFVGAVTEKVHQETGLDVHAWMASMSPELGTCVWAGFVETLDELEAAQDKLAVSEPYIEMTERAAGLFAGPLTDGLASVVHGGRDASSPMPSYITVARAQGANGNLSGALAAGVEIAEAAERITGAPGMFLVDVTGPYGGCRWTTGFADIGTLQRAEAALMADQSWLELIDRVGGCYAQGATQAIYRRMV